jgi:hypothetical protein
MDSPRDPSYNRRLSALERDVFRLRRIGVTRKAFAGAAGCLALLAAGATLAFAVAAGASLSVLADTTTEPVPTEPVPVPDPAPTPEPAPKPKATPKPVQSTAPKRTYSPPTRTYSAPTYTPARSSATTRPTKPRVIPKHKSRQPKPKKAVVTTSTPVETTPVPAVLVPVPLSAKRAPAQSGGDAVMTSILFVAGVSFAALLFLLAATVPGTPARFTPVGRVVIEHQQDFVLVGVAAFVITLCVYIITGHGL